MNTPVEGLTVVVRNGVLNIGGSKKRTTLWTTPCFHKSISGKTKADRTRYCYITESSVIVVVSCAKVKTLAPCDSRAISPDAACISGSTMHFCKRLTCWRLLTSKTTILLGCDPPLPYFSFRVKSKSNVITCRNLRERSSWIRNRDVDSHQLRYTTRRQGGSHYGSILKKNYVGATSCSYVNC